VVCVVHDEYSFHLFFECDKSVACWQHTDIWSSIFPLIDHTANFGSVVFAFLQYLNAQQKQIFGVTV